MLFILESQVEGPARQTDIATVVIYVPLSSVHFLFLLCAPFRENVPTLSYSKLKIPKRKKKTRLNGDADKETQKKRANRQKDGQTDCIIWKCLWEIVAENRVNVRNVVTSDDDDGRITHGYFTKLFKVGQWLWLHIWQSGWFWHQKTRVRIQSSIILLNVVNCT